MTRMPVKNRPVSRIPGETPGRRTPVKVGLINMPFASARRPSIQCGLLKAILNRAGYEADVFYFNLRLAAALGPELYSKLADNRWPDFLGDWLFAAAAFGPREDELLYLQTSGAAGHETRVGLKEDDLLDLRNRVLPALLDAWIEETDWSPYSAVGFSCTFDQNTASFAFARKLKLRFPNLITVFGGASFDDDSAAEYVRKLDWIDYIVVGEGDRALPSLVQRLASGESAVGISGVVGRSNGKVCAAPPELFRDLDSLPDPDYDHYFATLLALGRQAVLGSASTQLPFQAARGCWWGQKHHCAFCGLNGSSIAFRSRNPRLVYQELQRQSARYRTLKFIATDNILDMKYIDTLFSWMRDSRHDYALFYETKANLTRSQVRSLVQGGAKAIQAGIESLNTHVLQLMNKGTSMLLNLRLLKWARYYGLHVAWNLLTGFPGESLDDYQAQIKLIPKITHMVPPNSVDGILLQKYSPYADRASSCAGELRPAEAYAFVYPPGLRVRELALYYEGGPSLATEIEIALEDLKGAVEKWRSLWKSKTRPVLVYQRAADWIRFEDRRDPENPKTTWLSEPYAVAYECCSDTGQTVGATARRMQETLGRPPANQEVERMLREMTDAGLMAEENERFLSLALPANSGW
jgi:ribosomal peptide maturation radical SAM protein 1